MDIYPDVTVAALAPKVIDTKDAFINMGDNQSSSSPSMTQITLALKGLKQLPESGVIDVKLTLTIAPEVSAAAKRATINNQERHRPSGSLISSHASKVVAKTIEVKVVGRVVDLATAKEIEGLAAAGGTSNMQGSPNQVGIPTHALDRPSPHTLLLSVFPISSPCLPACAYRHQSPTASTVMTARSNYPPDTARTAVDSSLCYVACDIQEALRAAAKAAGTEGTFTHVISTRSVTTAHSLMTTHPLMTTISFSARTRRIMS